MSKANNSPDLTKRHLDNLNTKRMARGITLFSPNIDNIKNSLSMANNDIDGLANFDCVKSVYKHNPNTLMCFTNGEDSSQRAEATSFIAFLPLTQLGTEALLNGQLDTANPELKFVSKQNECPASIYVWCMHLTPKTTGGIALAMERIQIPSMKDAPLYCIPANEKARKFFLDFSFVEGVTEYGHYRPELMKYDRQYQAVAKNAEDLPLYAGQQDSSRGHELSVSVVHDSNEFQRVLSIRSATYIAEQNCPFDEEFDGNDFACTHLLATVDGEPAGCIRMRFFAGFTKVERLAVIPRFRKTRIADRLIRTAIELGKKKGYQYFYGHAEPRVMKLWQRHGFVPRTAGSTFSFSGRDFVEGDAVLDLVNDPISLSTSPEVINRPEGLWHKTGILG